MPRPSKTLARVQMLRRFVRRERRMPTYAEMLQLFAVRSRNMVFKIVLKLVNRGFVTKDRRGHLAATDQLTGSVLLLGEVTAGFPSPAEEVLLETLKLDEFLVAKPEATFMLRVDGEWTMKYFQKDAQGVRLEPANTRYHTIRPKRSLELAGVVTCVIRKYL